MIEPVHDQSVNQIDMSPQAISDRLNLVSELHEPGRYLAQAQPVEDETRHDPESAETQP